MIQELIQTISIVAEDMKSWDYQTTSTDELIAKCIEWETALFRARIKLEREINHK